VNAQVVLLLFTAIKEDCQLQLERAKMDTCVQLVQFIQLVLIQKNVLKEIGEQLVLKQRVQPENIMTKLPQHQ
jgi:hypothetical protein